MPGKLYLIPSAIGDSPVEQVIPAYISGIINHIRYFIVEDERTARRMLIKLGITTPIDDLNFFLLNEHTDISQIPGYMEVIQDQDVGLLSEAGVPAIADPGSDAVRLAHEKGITVVPLVGPSSVLLAMMASGMNGQNFAFIGYVPVNPNERVRKIKQLEQRSQNENQSQIFIEAPYRNNQLLKDLLANCSDQTLICIACKLTCPDGWVRTRTVIQWKKEKVDLHKKPVIFILHK
jgi:16S rRNA (cytidine1402-2'-O)-methyltransferase